MSKRGHGANWAGSEGVLIATEGRNKAWRVEDTLLLGAAVFFLCTVAYVCGRGRIFWEDELLGWMLLRDPSFGHMLESWRHGADGGGITFYLTGRVWFWCFGASITSFRAYTQCCFSIGFAATWVAMRRFYGTSIVACSCLLIWCVSPALVQHLTEGRFYGLLVGAVALGILLNIDGSKNGRSSYGLYVAMFAVHSVMVTAHILGVFYSFVLLCHLVVLDRLNNRVRLGLYACVVGPWLLLIPSLPAIRASAAVGKPYFWTTQPSVFQFVINYTGFTPLLGLLLGLLFVGVFVALYLRHTTKLVLLAAAEVRRPAYVLLGVFSLVPVVLLMEGFVGTPLGVSRYLLPMILPTTWMCAEVMTLAVPLLPLGLIGKRLIVVSGWTVFLVTLAAYDFGYRTRHTTLQRDYTGVLTHDLPEGVPVICEDAFSFTELISRQHASGVLYTYLLDWSMALAADAPRLEVTQYHLMENWRRAGYFSGSIRYRDEMEAYPMFYTLSFRDTVESIVGKRSVNVARIQNIGSNLHARLAASGKYRVTAKRVVPLNGLEATLWQVCRIGTAGCD